MTSQMTLFSHNNQADHPLPLQIASEYGFALQCHTQDDDTVVYAVQDWIAGIAQATAARDFWQKLKKRLDKTGYSELYARCLQLPYRASNGKTYQMDFADDETLYQITQRMDTNTGIRNDVLTFLAKAGAFVDELRQDPEAAQQKIATHRQSQALKSGKPASWIAQREMGVITRNELTALVVKVCPEMNIGEVTNIGYKGTLGHDAKGLRKMLAIGEKQNPRDHMSEVALAYTMVHEASVRALLSGYAGSDFVPSDVVRKVIQTVADSTGKQAQETAKLIGVDLVTGRKLLSAKH